MSRLLRFLSDSKYPTTPKQGFSASESELLGGFEESPLSAAGRSMGAAVSHNRRSYAGRVKAHMMQRTGRRRATQALQRPSLDAASSTSALPSDLEYVILWSVGE